MCGANLSCIGYLFDGGQVQSRCLAGAEFRLSGKGNHTELERRALALFEDAAELDPAQRASWLEQACGDQADLKQRVLQLLQSEGEAAGLRTGDVPIQISVPPQNVGPYELLEPIGAGGTEI